jgi:hypothetical protein
VSKLCRFDDKSMKDALDIATSPFREIVNSAYDAKLEE